MALKRGWEGRDMEVGTHKALLFWKHLALRPEVPACETRHQGVSSALLLSLMSAGTLTPPKSSAVSYMTEGQEGNLC